MNSTHCLNVAQLSQWFNVNRARILEDFFTFLAFQSISTDRAYQKEIRRTAEWLESYLKSIGLEVVLWETPGHPVIFASHLQAGPSRPTLLIYNHYDVQPVDPLELWKSDPFKPEIRGDSVYARGASDNKGQCFYTITAIKAVLQMARSLNLNIKLFIEGEEEAGSNGTFHILRQKKAELKADHLLIVDAGMLDATTPAVTVGMRGLVTLEVECRNASIDLHSGIHGGIALNPNRALAQLLATLWDKEGRIAIAHFYDAVQPISTEALSLLDLSFDLEQYKQTFGVKAFCPEKGYSLKESNWLRPSLEINGICGRYIGPGFKTVIPSKASAKLSCRLVSGQDPDQVCAQIERHLRLHVAQGVELKVKFHQMAKAFYTSSQCLIATIAASCCEEIFKKSCRFILCGASVPIVVDLADVSEADTIAIGLGLEGDDIHAPNEHFSLDRFERGFLMMGRILSNLAE